MIDELVEVSGKSGPHVVWRPGTNGELIVAAPSGGFPFEVPYQDVKRWNPADDKFGKLCQKAFRGVTRSRWTFTKQVSVNARADEQLPLRCRHFASVFGEFLNLTKP